MTTILIITALEEERDAVLSKFEGFKKVQTTETDFRVYFRTNINNKNNEKYDVILTCLMGMGRVEAASATEQAIRTWKPNYVLLVGIAGGIKKNGINLGDILVSNQIVDFSSQKISEKEVDYRFKAFPVNSRLLAWAQNLIEIDLSKLISSKENTPKRHIGPIASGETVVAKDSLINDLLKSWSKLIGIEMESSGVAYICHLSEEKPNFFMVRGVSDLADKDKDKEEVFKWRQYACEIAAAYTYELLISSPFSKPNQSDQVTTSQEFDHIKDQSTNKRIQNLAEEYEAVSQQISSSIDAVERVRLNRKLEIIENEINKIKNKK